MSLEKAIAQRRSVREFAETPLTIDQISQLCWAGQGITEEKTGFRAAPSAGALYPIELYVVTAEAVDHYQPRGHALKRHISGDIRPALQRAALGQKSIGDAPTCIVITAVVKRTARKYGERAERYCFLEAGHVAQNILLQATALRLGGVPVGAFEDQEVARVLNLRGQERVMYLIPIGQPGDQK
jgi:SagB-type dehydrogenase family enzyme